MAKVQAVQAVEIAALEQLGDVLAYDQAGLSKEFASMVRAEADLAEKIHELEDRRKPLRDDIKELLAGTGLKKVMVGDYAVQLVDSTSHPIDRNRLIAALQNILKVPAAVIAKILAKATLTRNSTALRIRDTTKEEAEVKSTKVKEIRR